MAAPALAALGPAPALAEEMLAMEVYSTYMDNEAGTTVVVLQDELRSAFVPIWIGPAEALAIEMALSGAEPPRPMTHDLLKSTIEALGGEVVEVRIVKLEQGIFHAAVIIAAPDGDSIAIDARASDSIALAVRVRVPILVARSVVDAAAIEDDRGRTDI